MSEPTILNVPVFSTLCNEAFRIRRAVFIEEQAIPEAEEFDADDLTATHLVAIVAGEACATLRTILDPEHVRIGRVAVLRAWRGRGIAGRLMHHAMETHRHLRGNRFFLSAQQDKMDFYRRFGFAAYGEAYCDGGIPHLSMRNY